MPFVPLRNYLPEIAGRETRALTVLVQADGHLPPGKYVFSEMFCDETGCDCRRVFFCVGCSFRPEVLAVVAWGWEDPAFYAKWMKGGDPREVAMLKGPILNLGSPESELAPAILQFVCDRLLKDPAYVERVKRHYAMFRRKIDQDKQEDS